MCFIHVEDVTTVAFIRQTSTVSYQRVELNAQSNHCYNYMLHISRCFLASRLGKVRAEQRETPHGDE